MISIDRLHSVFNETDYIVVRGWWIFVLRDGVLGVYDSTLDRVGEIEFVLEPTYAQISDAAEVWIEQNIGDV